MGKRKSFAEIYAREVQKEMGDKTPIPATRPRAEIETGIAEITALLKGPLHSSERLSLVGDRNQLRRELAWLDQQTSVA